MSVPAVSRSSSGTSPETSSSMVEALRVYVLPVTPFEGGGVRPAHPPAPRLLAATTLLAADPHTSVAVEIERGVRVMLRLAEEDAASATNVVHIFNHTDDDVAATLPRSIPTAEAAATHMERVWEHHVAPLLRDVGFVVGTAPDMCQSSSDHLSLLATGGTGSQAKLARQGPGTEVQKAWVGLVSSLLTWCVAHGAHDMAAALLSASAAAGVHLTWPARLGASAQGPAASSARATLSVQESLRRLFGDQPAPGHVTGSPRELPRSTAALAAIALFRGRMQQRLLHSDV